jgi:hypothetical protein
METIRFRKSSIAVKLIIIGFTALFIFNSFVCLFPIYFSGVNALKSAEEYFAMAESAHGCIAEMLRAMGRDEQRHAESLLRILERMM